MPSPTTGSVYDKSPFPSQYQMIFPLAGSYAFTCRGSATRICRLPSTITGTGLLHDPIHDLVSGDLSSAPPLSGVSQIVCPSFASSAVTNVRLPGPQFMKIESPTISGEPAYPQIWLNVPKSRCQSSAPLWS